MARGWVIARQSGIDNRSWAAEKRQLLDRNLDAFLSADMDVEIIEATSEP